MKFCRGERCYYYSHKHPSTGRSCYYEPACILGVLDEILAIFKIAVESIADSKKKVHVVASPEELVKVARKSDKNTTIIFIDERKKGR